MSDSMDFCTGTAGLDIGRITKMVDFGQEVDDTTAVRSLVRATRMSAGP